MKLNGTAPKAMLMRRAEAIIAMGCIIADIPLVHRIPEDGFGSISTGDTVEVHPNDGTVKLWKNEW
jgi:predicted aconitase with swiveling domain